ncbi:MAG: MATE family efflux transporter [Clostridia bacterium]|nr:MATE family efflux transporter [Clostridia bacterium]
MAAKKLDLTDETISPVKVIIWLAWPLFLEQILSTAVSFADTAMVGALGVTATASISISNSFVFLLNGVMMALGTGLTAYVARSVGARDYEAARSYIRHAVILLLLVGLPIAILTCGLHRQIPRWMGAEPEILDQASEYLLITSLFRIFSMSMMVLGSVFRGRGDTKTPLRINIFVNIINIVGNYLLINAPHTVHIFSMDIPVPGAGWGVIGAAISTGASWLVGGSVLAVMLFVKKDPSRISLRDSFKPDRAVISRVVNLSIPAMLERFCMSFAGIVVTRCIASLGTVVLAANSVFSTAESISFMPAFAFATAVTTLVGQSLGAKKPDLAVRYTRCTIAIGGAVMVFAGVMLYVFAEPLVRVITPDEQAVALAKTCLRIVAFIQPVQTAAWIFAGALRGAGDTKWPFYITAVCNWGIRTVGVYLCIRVFHLGLPEAVVCMCADNAVRCVWTGLRFHSRKWENAIQQKRAAA